MSVLRPPRPLQSLHVSLGRPDEPVRAGGRFRLPLRIENLAESAQEIILKVEAPGDGWRADLPVKGLLLNGGFTTVLFLRVDVPAAASVGERQTFRITAAGSERPDRAASVVVECIVSDA